MARKGKKKGRSGKFRPPMGVAQRAAVQAGTRAVPQARTGGDQAMVRAVEMSLGPRNQPVRGRTGRIVMESGDPAIPLDRVPYFTRDLIRLGIVGAAMMVLLAVGSVALPQIVK
jgi:hypothetical protein